MNFPAPVIHVAIEPKTKGDQEKLGTAIQRLAEEDPTFQVRTDEETGQTIIAGMGELHLEVLVDRMQREFKVEANVGKPQVAYRETIRRRSSSIDYTHKKQTGGSGQFAKVQIDDRADRRRRRRLRVREQGHRWPHPEGVHPVGRRRRARRPWSSASSPATRWSTSRSRCSTVRYHEVDSSELAFKIAGSMAFKEAARKADPVLLEPMMAVEVTTPEDYMGDVIGDLNSRRGQIQAMEERSGARVVKALVPAVGDVRLRRRPAQQDPGPRQLLACSSTPTPRFRGTSRRRSSRRPGASRPQITGARLPATRPTRQHVARRQTLKS